MRLLFPLLFLFALIANTSINAQQKRCSTYEYLQNLYKQDPSLKLIHQQHFDNITLLAEKYKEDKTRATPKKITVVVHVIHNGSELGKNENIPDSVIHSQIEALNEDYNLKNSDSIPNGHRFKSVTANAGIEFCLAAKDPNGNATTGITRHVYTTPPGKWDFGVGGSADFDLTVKPVTTWDYTQYLNIWVCDLEPNTLGYATPPSWGGGQYDGVVIGYKYFGWKGTALSPTYNLGRTAVHEVGHYLGLAHIWGDDGNGNGACDAGECSGDDGISDTPNQCDNNWGCPSTSGGVITDNCTPSGNGIMYMNYMDYVDDKCMYMFTNGQKARMQTELTQFPRSGIVDNGKCYWPLGVTTAVSLKNQIQVYPNPAAAYVLVDTKLENLSISIMDMTGKEFGKQVFTEKVINGYKLHVESLSSGIYFINVSDGQSKHTFKISKN